MFVLSLSGTVKTSSTTINTRLHCSLWYYANDLERSPFPSQIEFMNLLRSCTERPRILMLQIYYLITVSLSFQMTTEHGEKITFRGCQLDGGKTNPCDIVQQKVADQKGVKIEHCSICEKDNCNGSTNLQFNFWSILIPATLFLYMSRTIL